MIDCCVMSLFAERSEASGRMHFLNAFLNICEFERQRERAVYVDFDFNNGTNR